MMNSEKFFENRECAYFPCHKIEGDFNCLFCYCPLYNIDNCPGNYKMVNKNGRMIKNCVECDFPHIADNYDKVIAVLKHNYFI